MVRGGDEGVVVVGGSAPPGPAPRRSRRGPAPSTWPEGALYERGGKLREEARGGTGRPERLGPAD